MGGLATRFDVRNPKKFLRLKRWLFGCIGLVTIMGTHVKPSSLGVISPIYTGGFLTFILPWVLGSKGTWNAKANPFFMFFLKGYFQRKFPIYVKMNGENHHHPN